MRTIQEIGKDLLECISETLKKNPNAMVGWAVNYIGVMKEAINPYSGRPMTNDEMYTQILYVENNLTTWRHPRAKELRNELRAFKATLKQN